MEELFVAQPKESAVETVINNIKRLLLERKLMPGDRLPNELELSRGLNVSRGSIREAMKILSAYGIIEVKVGDGTYIASSLRNGMIEPLLFSFLLSKTDLYELAEFRRLIEMDIAELVILHSDKNQEYISKMKENVDQILVLQRQNAPINAFVENDMEFHILFGKASCNLLIEKVYKFILDYLKKSISYTHNHQDPGTCSYESHKRILDAIDKKDASIAQQAIDYTVDVWRQLQVL